MGWMSKLIERHNNKAKCLICEVVVPKDSAIVEYKHADGIGKAFLCKGCEEEFGTTRMGGADETI